MANVPYDQGAGQTTESQVGLPDDYQRIQANPGQFGATIATGMQQFGQGAVKASQFYDQVSADDVTNNYFDQTNKRLYGDPSKTTIGPDGQPVADTGFFGLRGSAQMAARPALQQAMDQDLQNYRSQLKTPEAQLEFDRNSRRYRTMVMERVGVASEHAMTQYGMETTVGQAHVALTEVSNNAYDDNAFNHGLADLTNAYLKRVDLQGLGPVGAQAAKDQALADAWRARLETMGVHDPAKAAALADQHQKELGVAYEPIANSLRARADAQAGEQAGKAALTAARTGQSTTGVARETKGPNDVYGNIPDVDSEGRSGQLAKFKQWNPDPVGLSAYKLDEVHPDLQAIVRKAQADNPNLQFVVALGKSSPQQEQLAKDWGWSQAGTLSHHIQGNVVDLWPLDGSGKVNFDTGQQQKIAAAMNKAAGELGYKVRWGGLASEGGANKSFRDAPNFELLNPRPLSADEQARQNAASQTTAIATQAAQARAQRQSFSPGSMPAAQDAGQYQPVINSAAQKWGVDPAVLTRQLWQENHFHPTGTSPAGAQGFAQFIPSTAARYGVNVNDPQSSIEGAAHYMHDLLGRYNGNVGLALAAYNWGEKNVDRYIQAGDTTVPSETANYVQSITGHGIKEWRKDPNLKIQPGTMTAQGSGGTPTESGASVMPASFSPGEGAGASPTLPPVDQAPSTVVTPPEGTPLPQSAPPAPPSPEQVKAAALAAIENNPDLSDAAKQHAQRTIIQQVAEQEIIEGANAKARKEQEEKSAGGYVTRMLTGQGAPGIAQEIANDSTLTWQTKEHLYDAVKKYTGSDSEQAGLAYGPGFWKYYRQVTAPVGDPERITDPMQFLSHAGPNGDLTLAGVQKLMQTVGESRKSVDSESINRAKSSILQGMKERMSFDQTMLIPGLPQSMARDPKGEQIFNLQAVPQFEAAFDAWTKAGKDPWEFLNDTKRFEDMATRLRPPQQMAMDKMVAAGGMAEPANMPLPPPPQGIRPEIWQPIVAAPPVAPDGLPVSHYAWSQVLSALAANPTPETVAQIKASKFGKLDVDWNKIATELTSTQSREAPAPPHTHTPDNSVRTLPGAEERRRLFEKLNPGG